MHLNSIKQITPALVIVGILNTSKTLPRGLNSDNQIILSSLIVTFVVHYFKCQKGKELGLDEEAHAEPVRRSKNDCSLVTQCRINLGHCRVGRILWMQQYKQDAFHIALSLIIK